MYPRSRSTPTISQVATLAGVNRSTVSRAFTRPDMLNTETVERVMEAARSMGYVPNHTARALSTGRYGNIALIVPDVANPFFPPLIRAAQKELDRLDFCLFLGNSDEDPRQEDRLVGRLAGQVEGMILASSRLPEERIRTHAAARPLVLINRDIEGIPRVLIDSGSGVGEAMEHLAGLGHATVAYVSGPANSWSNRQRRGAVRKAADRLGLKHVVVPAALPSYEAGVAVAAAVLRSGATAAIAFDDVTAHGLLAGLAGRGVPVPGAFSVIGCDDVLGAATYPPLTTVSNRSPQAGKAALSLLMEVLASRSIRDVRYVLETHLVVRRTTATAPT
ncbi:MAG: LacI family transcriptional regulator [Rhizobiaceae bacterium]|jgi:LacI family transcriptional regulator|nr:LacI family transcriptional regulator [Rhizobiaceae bacterium]